MRHSQAAVKAISKSRKKAGDALGKMKARGKQFAVKKGRGLRMMQDAVATVKAQNEMAREERKGRNPKMRVWVDRLMARHR